MIIWNKDYCRVLQHEHLKVFHVQAYGECDNPRSYGRHIDWYTEKEFFNIEDVITYLREKGFNVSYG